MRKQNKISFRKLPEFEQNPFVQKAIEDIRTVKKMQFVQSRNGNTTSEIQMIVGEKSGEITGHSVFVRYIEVDEEKFAKFYLSQFEHFWELPSSAIRVFGYILTKLRPKQDEFEFYMDEAKEFTKYVTHQPIILGLASLIENGIIAKTIRTHKFYINPLVVFNGDRVTFAKTYIKKKEKGKLDNPMQRSILDEIEERKREK